MSTGHCRLHKECDLTGNGKKPSCRKQHTKSATIRNPRCHHSSSCLILLRAPEDTESEERTSIRAHSAWYTLNFNAWIDKMALPMLVNSTDCGPVNPLQGLAKRFDQDRGIQQVCVFEFSTDGYPIDSLYNLGSVRGRTCRTFTRGMDL